MKNLVKLMFMALAMCFVACGEFGNGGNDGNGGSDNTPLTFTIGISNITSSTAKVTVTPSNNDKTYYYDIVDKETLDFYYDGSIAKCAKDLVEYITKDLGKTMEEYVVSGKDVYIFDSLEASTDYYIFAFGVLNDGTITSNIAYKAFKTTASSGSGNGGSTGGESSKNTFSISVNNISATSANVAITPSNSDTYYFDVVAKEVYDAYTNKTEFAKEYVAQLKEMLAEYGYTIADILSSGSDSYYYNDQLDPSTEYVAFVFGLSSNGTITTAVTSSTFTTLAGSGSGSGSGSGESAEDKVITSLVHGEYENYGDFYETGALNWLIQLDDQKGDDIIILEVQTPLSATDFTGEYTFASTFASGTAVAGFDYESYLYGSFWYREDANGKVADYLFLSSGKVSITKSGDIYTVSIDATTDLDSSLKATYTGTIPKYEESATVSKTSTLNKFSSVAFKKQVKAVKMTAQSAAKTISVKRNLVK